MAIDCFNYYGDVIDMVFRICTSTILYWESWRASDIREVLTVNNEEDEEPGSYNFTYVSVLQATALRLLIAQFNPYADIVSAEEMTVVQTVKNTIG